MKILLFLISRLEHGPVKIAKLNPPQKISTYTAGENLF